MITTKGTPWQDIEDYKCGWWIDVGVDPLTETLEKAMALSEDERLEMGLRGREMIDQRYDWSNIARRMILVYEWLLGSGDRPDCVRTK